MVAIFGTTGKVSLGTSSADIELVGLLTSYSLKTDADVKDVSYMDSFMSASLEVPWVDESITTSYSWSGDAKGYYQAKDETTQAGYLGQLWVRNAITNNASGAKQFLRIYINTVTAHEIYYEGYARITNFTLDNDAKSGLNFSFSYKGLGPLTVHNEGDA